MSLNKAVIVSYSRTPIAKFCGSLSSLSAPQLASQAITSCIQRAGTNTTAAADLIIDEAILGNVISAGIGQAPTRQAVLGANLPQSTICTTINKVCASGLKSAMLGAQSVMLDRNRVVLCGGMESMSNVPYYLQQYRQNPSPLGHGKVIDGVIHDGLWDVYNNQHMGMCAEKCAQDYAISREEQDEYAIESYQRAIAAQEGGKFDDEIVPVTVPSKRRGQVATIVSKDEEPGTVNLEKLPNLRPAFLRDDSGTVTAANASSLNDGAAAMIIMSEERAKELHLEPLARIVGFGDAAQAPEDFTTAPAKAVPIALQNAKVQASDIDYHEINEAFSVVSIANMKLLNLDAGHVNIFGGAVSLGHPIGMSGARILGTLYHVLKDKDGTLGCASICNGGGGASAVVLERLK
mmetsp:Transcript_9850/g.14768  ORF Transcript_9850/g.14768 Transcript_9850/m.14768 type:complete len:406 (-) Transcript_9850:392-1609(-)|eukprot:CAMPEP_0116030644 /NCGR_PEP_ID=MMETSP0321-20121206/16983_1 /TAXON_ID=163516 /ORGANISM="Leptocylindrus danicus var. danicus, Strain B650" /LENGTH=405 /DNA_ID=CAMNT_0003505501 /DNA_START=72 /DNA_END=1289 /DNA_ORIENTATION=+